MPNGYFLIKQRETGAGGPPVSLSAGQFAFNKVDSTLYLGTTAEIVPVGGAGAFATNTLVSSITGNYPTWNNVSTAVQNNSANWGAGVSFTSVATTSASWNQAYSNVNSNSANTWNYQGTDLKALSANWESAYSTVNSNSAVQWNYQGTDLKGLSGNWQQAYTNLTSNSAAYLSAHETAGGDLTGTYPNPTVAKLQGHAISTAAPEIGQMLQWTGTAWVPGSIPQGGSGGGGISYFLNYGTASDSHPGLPNPVSELGRFTYTTLTNVTLTDVATDVYTPIAGFITDFLDPVVTTIPAGLWDIAIWLSSTATTSIQMILKAELYTYNTALSTTTLIGTSDDLDIYDPTVIAQYTPSIVVPQTSIGSEDRIYLKLLAKATSNNKDITVYFGGNRPSHIHTTIPSVGGSGLVKTVNGVYQSPASLLVDVDVAENAQINQSKILGLAAALTSKLPLSGGTLTDGLSGTTAQFSGAVYGSTAVAGTSSTQLATTAFVQNNLTTGLASGSAVASTLVAFVTNADDVPLVRGNVVYSYGSQGDRASVKLASASSESTSSKTFGFVNETIAVGQTGYVTLYGTMDKLDLGSPFVPGDALWLGTTPGTYTRTKPVAPIHLVYLGVVERANAGNGTAYIKIQNGYELNEIHDVLINEPSANQVIRRNSANTLWTNQTLTTENWDSVYSTVNSNSAVQWNYQGTDLKELSGNWQGAYTNLTSNSAAYLSAADASKLINGELEVVLASTGQVNLPKADNSGTHNSRIQSVSSIDILADQQLWTFGKDGKLAFPDGTKQTTAYDTVSSSQVKTKVNTIATDVVIGPNGGEILRITTTTSPLLISIPKNGEGVSFEVGTQIALFNIGTHSVSFSAGPDVTLYSSGNNYVLSSQGDSASLIQTNLNEWILCGNLTS